MIAAKSRDQYLAEVQELIARFEELEVAFRPAPGETTTMIVPVALLRNLMRFCETSLSRLQKVADFFPTRLCLRFLRRVQAKDLT